MTERLPEGTAEIPAVSVDGNRLFGPLVTAVRG